MVKKGIFIWPKQPRNISAISERTMFRRSATWSWHISRYIARWFRSISSSGGKFHRSNRILPCACSSSREDARQRKGSLVRKLKISERKEAIALWKKHLSLFSTNPPAFLKRPVRFLKSSCFLVSAKSRMNLRNSTKRRFQMQRRDSVRHFFA